jgi:hypothetical protein
MFVSNLEMSTVFMWCCSIRERGRVLITAGRSFENRLHSIMRCLAVCSAFSGAATEWRGHLFHFMEVGGKAAVVC